VRVSEHASVSGEQLQPWVAIGGRDAVLCISAWWQTEPTSSGPRALVLGEVAAWTAAVAPASMNSAVVSKLRLRGPRLRAFGVWVFVTALCVCVPGGRERPGLGHLGLGEDSAMVAVSAAAVPCH
jgi:drug/metabolite transporter (DMT)-like permease